MEYHGGTEAGAFDAIRQKIRDNTEAVLTRSRTDSIEPRRAALELATERVRAAMTFRRTD